MFALLSINVIIYNPVPNHFSDYFTQVSDIHHHNDKPPMVTFFLRERIFYSIVNALFVLMEQKFGITFLLISETLHHLETSRKIKIKQLLLESYNSEV